MANETELPIGTLDRMIEHLEVQHDNMIHKYTPDWEESSEIAEYVQFLIKLRKLYIKCAGCGRLMAPDEERSIRGDNICCRECNEHGKIEHEQE